MRKSEMRMRQSDKKTLAFEYEFSQFWYIFKYPHFQVGHVLSHHCDVIRWPIFMILMSNGRRDPTLYHGAKQSDLGVSIPSSLGG